MAVVNLRAGKMKPILYSGWLPEQIKGTREQGSKETGEQGNRWNKAIGEQENRGRREQSSLCTDTPSPQKKIGKRDVCESPSLIVFRCIFAYFFCCFSSGGWKVLTEQHDCGLLLFITEYVMLWKISTRTCSTSCCFDLGSTVLPFVTPC